MIAKPLRFAVVGLGYWGPNLLRNLQDLDDAEAAYMCDLDGRRLAKVSKRYPAVAATTRYEEVLQSSKVDAVIVATPVSTHHALAMAAIRAGKHVLIEKPLASSSEEALSIIEAAQARGVLAAVDHTFLYTGAVRKLRSLIAENRIGQLCYIDSVRVNLGIFQQDVDVVWDLAVHDLSIIDYLTERGLPLSVSATGAAHVGRHANTAYISLAYAGNMIAHVHVNWLAPVKVRQMLVGGSKGMIVYDDLQPSEKIRMYDRAAEVKSTEEIYKTLVQYRTGDVWAPFIDTTEALSRELREFTAAVMIGAPLASPAEAGLRVVQVLEAATASMRANGSPVSLTENAAR